MELFAAAPFLYKIFRLPTTDSGAEEEIMNIGKLHLGGICLKLRVFAQGAQD